MGVTYTGDRTLTNDPVAAPEAGRQPAATVPVDTDPPNASTFVAGYKAAMDWIDWLRRPIAKAAAWVTAIRRYQSARGHTRFMIDHLGYPGGWIITDQMYWGQDVDVEENEIIVLRDGWWLQTTNFPNTSISGGGEFEQGIQLDVTDAGGIARILTPYFSQFDADHDAVFEVAVWAGFGAGNGLVRIGIGNGADDHFVEFRLTQADPEWGTYRANGSGPAGALTAIAATGAIPYQRLRVEYHGADVDDSAAARVLFFINGTQVATYTTDLPGSYHRLRGYLHVESTGGTVSAQTAFVKLAANLVDSDV